MVIAGLLLSAWAIFSIEISLKPKIESLKNKTVAGVGWSAADAMLGNGTTFLVGLVLARILSPDE